MSNFRRRLMMNFEKKYTPVKYLESTGTQYINTNYKPNGNTIIELKYQTPTQNTTQQGIFGARDTGNNRFTLFTGNVKNGFQADYAKSDSLLSWNQNIPGVDGTAINVIKMSNSFTINNNDINKISKQIFQNSQNMYLFANNNNGIAQLPMKGYIWYFKIYDNDTLVRDFIPVLDKDGVPCLYDKVEDKFYYNQGTGEFSYPIDEKYNRVEYIESTGTQYIDTGIKLSNNSNVEINAKLTATNKGKSYYLFGSSATDKRYMFAVGYSTNNYLVDFKSDKYRINSSVSAFDGKFHIHKILKLNYYIDNILQGTQTSLEFLNTQNAYLFDVQGKSSGIIGVQAWQIKYCKIYDNDTLVRNFVPCYRKSDNVVGMFDTAEGKFYTNQGTGEFLYK